MMVELRIDDALARKLEAIAKREQRPVIDVLHTMIEQYDARAVALETFIGALDDDVSDVSMTVRETMEQHYQQKYDNPD